MPVRNGHALPVATTAYMARGLCTLKAVQGLAANMLLPLHLNAGTYLGSARHGQPIPRT